MTTRLNRRRALTDAHSKVWLARCSLASRLVLFFSGVCVLSTTALAQPQTRFVVRIDAYIGGGLGNIHSLCRSQIQNYIDTHPNRTGGTLTFSTYAAALQAAKDIPCGGFDTIRLSGSRRASTYLSGGLTWAELQVSVVDHFQAHEPSIADPATAHTYYDGAQSHVVPGVYESRIALACNDLCTRVSWGTREFLTHVGADRWSCGCSVGAYGHPTHSIPPYCPQPLFQYAAGEQGLAKSGKCQWFGTLDIYSVNVDPAKAVDGACRTTHAGNPIDIAHGHKLQVESDFVDPRGLLDVIRVYSSSSTSGPTGWQINWNARAAISGPLGAQPQSIAFLKSTGQRITFDQSLIVSPPTLYSDADVNDILTIEPTEIRLRRVRDLAVDHYDPPGNFKEGSWRTADSSRWRIASMPTISEPT